MAEESCLRTLLAVALLLRSQDQQRVLSSLFLAPQLSTLQVKRLAVLRWNWTPTLPSPEHSYICVKIKDTYCEHSNIPSSQKYCITVFDASAVIPFKCYS
jgi:hypothetical protein